MFLANFVIALREGVEAAVLVGILVSFVIKMNRRDLLPKMWLGVGIAAAIPLMAGVAFTWRLYSLTFQAQEIVGGVLSIIAAIFVTWMMFWMVDHAANLKTFFNVTGIMLVLSPQASSPTGSETFKRPQSCPAGVITSGI